ncbi:MAG: hypothetical protein KGI28_10570 [Thaumarchaeota archaeon]|nr:hypothetical protein [Nitrososphaerota archaeon]
MLISIATPKVTKRSGIATNLNEYVLSSFDLFSDCILNSKTSYHFFEW